ncbi:MAG: DUF2628 domain-containing protein [Nitrosomonas sp.]|nr:DUF2628 domain-containing protein [Nitrosomonas sp.]
MSQYTIFSDSTGEFEAIKAGWSWPAFFFNVIWALTKGMWVLVVAILLLFLIAGMFVRMTHGDIMWTNGLSLVVSLLMGATANSLQAKKLATYGFEPIATVSANSPEQAITRYLEHNRQAAG